MFRFEELAIWQDSITFTSKIYNVARQFPKEELFSLSDQIKRSANSVSANIAEGSGSSSKKDFSHFLDIAIKSLYETVSHLHVAKELHYISEETMANLYKDAEILVKKIKSFRAWLAKNN